MTLTRTLWDILDSREGDPSIVDSQDPEVEGAYFQDKRSRLRWRVGITSAIALGGAMVLVVVGSFFWRNATPAVQEIASPAAATAAEVTESPGAAQLVVHVVGADNTYGHPTDKALGFLEALGTAALRSDQRGTLALGKNSAGALVVWSEKEEPSG